MKKDATDRPGTSGNKLTLARQTLRALGSKDLGQISAGKLANSGTIYCGPPDIPE